MECSGVGDDADLVLVAAPVTTQKIGMAQPCRYYNKEGGMRYER